MESQCSTCRFWKQTGDTPVVGKCRKYAPRAVAMDPLSDTTNLDVIWPRTAPTDWCGEWETGVATSV